MQKLNWLEKNNIHLKSFGNIEKIDKLRSTWAVYKRKWKNIELLKQNMLLLFLSHYVMFDSLWLCGPQTIRLSRSPLSPKVYSDSCPLSWWFYLTISFSAIPFSFAFHLFQHQGLFQRVIFFFFSSGSQCIGASSPASILSMIFRVHFLWDWLVWSPCNPRDSQESSLAPQFKSINSSALSLLEGPALTFIHDYWEYHSLTK